MAGTIRYTNFFDLLNPNGWQPVAALFMTYSFDAELFENQVLPVFLGIHGNSGENEWLFRRQTTLALRQVPVTVLSDAGRYQGGQTFLYDFIPIKDVVFHPKCYFLLFPEHLRVIISSGNLTKAGLCCNAETVWHTDLKWGEVSGLAYSLCRLLEWMGEAYDIEENDAWKEIVRQLKSCPKADGWPKLVSTIHKRSVFSQYFSCLASVEEECKSLSIVSPFYENDREQAMESSLLLAFANTFFAKYPAAKLRIYFPAIPEESGKGYRVEAPVNLFHKLCRRYPAVELYAVKREWKREEGEPAVRFLHAKLLAAEFKNRKRLIMSGSVNFTQKAMRSRLGHLSNMELGVVQYGKIRFALPEAVRTYPDELIYRERPAALPSVVIFVNSLIYCQGRLEIVFDQPHVRVPMKIQYQETTIYETETSPGEKIVLDDFKLLRSLELFFTGDGYGFYYPIYIVNKEDIPTEDLPAPFAWEMKDVIDYLAGRYRSLAEIQRVKALRRENEVMGTQGMMVYFRYSLQRYYKALGALRQGLEAMFYSEAAFRSYLAGPTGIKTLTVFMVEDYREERISDVEAFLLIAELENMVVHLQYPEDRLDTEWKKQEINRLMEPAVAVRKEIYQASDSRMQRQFDVLLAQYELEEKNNDGRRA